jgi:hypothetical protein
VTNPSARCPTIGLYVPPTHEELCACAALPAVKPPRFSRPTYAPPMARLGDAGNAGRAGAASPPKRFRTPGTGVTEHSADETFPPQIGSTIAGAAGAGRLGTTPCRPRS